MSTEYKNNYLSKNVYDSLYFVHHLTKKHLCIYVHKCACTFSSLYVCKVDELPHTRIIAAASTNFLIEKQEIDIPNVDIQ